MAKLRDPSGNVMELTTYADVEFALEPPLYGPAQALDHFR